MNILGLDVSTKCTGFFICDEKFNVIYCGKLKNQSILEQYNNITNLIKQYKVDHVAIEDVFCGRNVKTMKQLAFLHGAIILLLQQLDTPYTYYSVMKAKSIALAVIKTKAENGKRKTGKELKQEVQQQMFKIFGKFADESELDISDSASIAYSYIQTEVNKYENNT